METGRIFGVIARFIFWSEGSSVMVLQNGIEKDYTMCKRGASTATSTVIVHAGQASAFKN